MHEMSLMASLIRIIENKAEEEHFGRVKSIHLKIGELSCVSKEALDFAFSALKEKNSLLSSSNLFAETECGKAKCPKCEKIQQISSIGQKCEECGTYGLRIVGGDTIYIDNIIVEREF